MSASADETLGDERRGEHAAPEAADLDGVAVIGRFVLLERIGRGGMGTVFAAYDPHLDRRVALKLLHSGAAVSVRTESMLREAKAMARLAHPNVVAVHDVGSVRDQVFLAMEFVPGPTLGEWTRREQRPWQDVVEMFSQAGRGLAAAHEAGLVHGDFKPENVIVGEDGRARVTDFGLARPVEAAAAIGDDAARGKIARLGTPAYMAPEQHLGNAPDAASDQFAFCVALYEALHGERPFAGKMLAEIATEVLAGRIRSPPDGRVPAWLRQVCVHGLASKPSERHSSMDALLIALADDPTSRRRKRAGLLGVAGLVVVAGVVAFAVYRARARACDDAGAEASAVWSEGARAAIEDSFATAAPGHSRETLDRVAATLDDYVARWSSAHVDVCRGERDGSISATAATASRACLDEQLASLGASVDVMTAADAGVVERAVQLATGLPDPAECGDMRTLLTRPASPDDSVAATVAREDLEVVRVTALMTAGRYAAAEEITRALVDRVAAIEYAPLAACAELQHGIALAQLGRSDEAVVVLERAYFAAGRVRDFPSAVEAARWLVQLEAHNLGHLESARSWQAHAEMMLALVEPPSLDLEARVHAAIAALHNAAGHPDQALVEFERAHELNREHFGSEHYSIGFGEFNIGAALQRLGRHDDAIARFEAAQQAIEVSLGPQHPALATVLASEGFSLHQLGRFEQALAVFRRTLAIREAAFGSESTLVGQSLDGVGVALDALGHFDEGLEHHERALEIMERALGRDHIELTTPISNAGQSLWLAGEFEASVPYFVRAKATLEKTLGPEHPRVAAARHNLGEALRRTGDLDGAEAQHRQALATREQVTPDDLAALGDSRAAVAEILLARGRPAEALPLLEQALAGAEQTTIVPLALAEWRFALARALDETGGDATRAQRLAEQARGDLRALAPLGGEQLHAVERWLAKRP